MGVEAPLPRLPGERGFRHAWLEIVESRLPHQRGGGAPRLAPRPLAPGEVKEAEARHPPPPAGRAEEGLAAPKLVSLAEPEAIPGEDQPVADAGMLAGEHPGIGDWLVFTWDGLGLGERDELWGGEGRGVRLVMGDAEEGQPPCGGPAAARIAGMGVGGDHRRVHPVEAAEVANHLCEDVPGAGAFEVADMGRDHRPPFPAQRDRVFEMTAHGEHRGGEGEGEVALERGEAAAETQGSRRTAAHPHHRIIGRAEDGAVVMEEAVGDGGKAAARRLVLGDDRLAADIGGGRHQRKAERIEQEMMERAVGEEGAHLGEPRRHFRAEPACR